MIIASLFILFLPLLAFLIQIFWGRRLPRQGDFVAIAAVGGTLVIALGMLLAILLKFDPGFQREAAFEWVNLGAFQIKLGFLIDNITVIMLVVVALISTMSHIYSTRYMGGDPLYSRYFAYLGLFTFSMNGIVLANNLLSLYIFWELVGVSSYLLIGFWFQKDSAADAGKKAFLTNRVGDLGFFIGIMLFFTAMGSFNYQDIFNGVANGQLSGIMLTLAGLGLFCGAVGKSAQVPLHIWLPDAMEGPTPVSALIHAATMVAAGVYMLVRLFPIMTPDVLIIIAYVGGFTALFAATIAITQNDIKRVLAYSTLSQLGYMVMAVGTGAYTAGFFHLVTHAMFKASLFYGAGSVIYAMHNALHKLNDHETDAQDMRNMGGFKSRMPITYWTMVVATLAISGVPFLSGFISKDAILAGTLAFAGHSPQHFLVPFFGFTAAMITPFYMLRLIYLTFHNEPRQTHIYIKIVESPRAMTVPMIVLSSLTFFAFYTLPQFNPFAGNGWFTSLVTAQDSLVTGFAVVSAHEFAEQVHHNHTLAMILSVSLAGLGILFSWLFYLKRKLSADAWAQRSGFIYRWSFHKYYIDEIYDRFIYQPFLRLTDKVGYTDWDLYDQKFIDGFGRVSEKLARLSGTIDWEGLDKMIVNGIGRFFQRSGQSLRQAQTGRLQNYLLFALLAIIVILIIQVL
ncbi:MAG: NADH-quinone oxidoreductase subunit L [Candidatus Marinimicrobia bacterium]|nr:NADH-quinone oxidoreductase subunit L [Candidatus Neomarinimicrobiota bacterium]